MVQRATAVNPTILVWARERAGLAVGDIASRLGKEAALVTSWERGEAFPAYGQLEAIAEACKRPIALFFLPEPPEEAPLQNEFRTLPAADLAGLGSDTRFALRDAHAFQTSLRELTGGRNPTKRNISKDFHLANTSEVIAFARKVREYLAVPLAIQQSWSSSNLAMDAWRTVLEGVGIFVFKRSFKDRVVSGFCLHDDEFPLIVVNSSTPFARQIFTLFHELAHLLFGVSSITKNDPTLLARFAPADRHLEIACNRFASEFLVPEESFPWNELTSADIDSFSESMADLYNVSREVILRRLFDKGLVSNDIYATRAATWANDPAREGEAGGGGSYYATQSAYLSRTFLGLVFAQFRAGRISLPEISDHLRMRAKNVAKFEDFLFSRG